MTGLEKMKDQILSEARAVADGKIAEANRQAAELLDRALAEAEKSAGSTHQKSEKDAEAYRERMVSAIDLQKRTRILAAKQEVITDFLAKSYDRLRQMEAGAYFAMLLKLAEKYALPEQGIICFSQRDRERMPAGFEAKVKRAAEAKGGKLAVSEKEKDIEDGFILVYGGVEENCTWKAIFDAKRDELADKVHHLLF